MAKTLVTGSHGTIGSELKPFLEEMGIEVVRWDRSEVDLKDYQDMEDYIREIGPEVLIHLATASNPTGMENEGWIVNCEWPRDLAAITKDLGIKFVHISSVMVFTDEQEGPFTIEDKPQAEEGYGYEKRKSEELVLESNDEAVIARLGWQIGKEAGSNNMVDHFVTKMKEEGQIKASTEWYPACSFLQDTVAELYKLSLGTEAGIYQIDSNECWSFYEIATALNNHHGGNWDIVKTDDFVYDQRMIDQRIKIPALDKHLISL